MLANLHLAVIERVDKDNQVAGVFQLKFMKLTLGKHDSTVSGILNLQRNKLFECTLNDTPASR